MSLVVGLEEGGVIHMACDSQATGDSDKRYLPFPKIFNKYSRTESGRYEKYIIGFAGSLRVAQLVMRMDLPYDIYELPDVIQANLKGWGCLSKGKEDDIGEVETMQSNLLVGYKGSLYEIQGDFAILSRVDTYAAIGDAKQYALGCLYAFESMPMASQHDPEYKLKIALECSSYFCSTVGGKIHYFKM
jgi:ATP-dependent protease HslVU (ClpYQ) peptidase subunit